MSPEIELEACSSVKPFSIFENASMSNKAYCHLTIMSSSSELLYILFNLPSSLMPYIHSITSLLNEIISSCWSLSAAQKIDLVAMQCQPRWRYVRARELRLRVLEIVTWFRFARAFTQSFYSQQIIAQLLRIASLSGQIGYSSRLM